MVGPETIDSNVPPVYGGRECDKGSEQRDIDPLGPDADLERGA
jgi:hypothetical protein